MTQRAAQATSHGGSGLVQATVFYRGSTSRHHTWQARATVGSEKVYGDADFTTEFISAHAAAQLFANATFKAFYATAKGK